MSGLRSSHSWLQSQTQTESTERTSAPGLQTQLDIHTSAFYSDMHVITLDIHVHTQIHKSIQIYDLTLIVLNVRNNPCTAHSPRYAPHSLLYTNFSWAQSISTHLNAAARIQLFKWTHSSQSGAATETSRDLTRWVFWQLGSEVENKTFFIVVPILI